MSMNIQSGRSTAGLVLVGIGVFFLAAQIFGFSAFGAIWPFFIILPGVAFLYAAYTGDKNKAGLAVPGAIVTGTGAILLYQNLTDHWASWAYAWTLYPVFLGLALSFMGQRTGEKNTYKTGQGFIRWGMIAFVVGAVFFELVVFDHGALGNLLLPAILIAAGAWILMRGRDTGEKRKVDAPRYAPVNGTKAKNGYSPEERLQRQIDEALAEDDAPTPSEK
jgi:cell wall-active antibiotic response 4TMS protein YvqF